MTLRFGDIEVTIDVALSEAHVSDDGKKITLKVAKNAVATTQDDDDDDFSDDDDDDEPLQLDVFKEQEVEVIESVPETPFDAFRRRWVAQDDFNSSVEDMVKF